MSDISPLLDAAFVLYRLGPEIRDLSFNRRLATLRMKFRLARRNDARDHPKSTRATAVEGTPIGGLILIGEASGRGMAKVDVAFVVHAKSREALGCIGLAGHDVHRLTATLLELDRRDGCLC